MKVLENIEKKYINKKKILRKKLDNNLRSYYYLIGDLTSVTPYNDI